MLWDSVQEHSRKPKVRQTSDAGKSIGRIPRDDTAYSYSMFTVLLECFISIYIEKLMAERKP